MIRVAWVGVVLALAFVLAISVTRRSEQDMGEPDAIEVVEGAVTPAIEVVEGAVTPAIEFELPLGLREQALVVPSDNPMSAAKIALGEQLFFDTRLSATQQMSCETCHVPEQGWADGLLVSSKHDGSLNVRHTPSLYGVGFYPELYWDGRAQGLEAQILAAWEGQMGADADQVSAEVARIDGYRAAFQDAFGGPATETRILQALGSFVRTIHAGDTPWDRHPRDEASLAASEIGRGFKVFSEVAQCTLCHLPPVFADTLFHNVGIGMDTDAPDLGRAAYLAAIAERSGEPATAEAERMTGAFKTPTLRGIAQHPPYFHDGRAETLEEAVDLMIAGGLANEHRDEILEPRDLTPEQRRELLAFLAALSPDTRPYRRPELPR